MEINTYLKQTLEVGLSAGFQVPIWTFRTQNTESNRWTLHVMAEDMAYYSVWEK